jgi:hypothetical protein
LVNDPGVVRKFCFLTVARTCPAVGKFASKPRIFYQFSYRYTPWASTELVNIYPTSSKKSDFYQQTLSILPIFIPQWKIHSSVTIRPHLRYQSSTNSQLGLRSAHSSHPISLDPAVSTPNCSMGLPRVVRSTSGVTSRTPSFPNLGKVAKARHRYF